MADGSNEVPIAQAVPRTKRAYRFPEAIGEALYDHETRVHEARSTLKLLQQHVDAPPDGQPDYGMVSGAVDAAIRLLKSVESLHEPLELERRGKLLLNDEENDRG